MKKMLLKLSKKSLALILSVLMILTSWVWFVPSKVGAYSELTAFMSDDQISAFKTFIGAKEDDTYVVNTTYGIFTNDSKKDEGKTYHKNVFISGTAISQVGVSNYKLSDDGALESANIFYPNTVLIYDGTTTPQFGVSLRFDSKKGCNVHHWGTGMSGTNLSFVNSNWYGYSDGSENGKFMDAITGGNTQCGTTSASSDSGVENNYKPDEGGWVYLANVIKYDGNLGSDRNSATYYTTISPSFSSHFSQAEDCGGYKGDTKNISLGTATNSVAVINIVPWKTALEHAAKEYLQIVQNGEMNYTSESIANFKKYAKALFDNHPSNLVTSTSDVADKKFEANKTAVNDYYNKGQLVEARYTVEWKNGSTTIETDSNLKYGEAVPTFDGTEPTKAPDATNHYTFKGWDPTPSGTISGNATYTATFDEIAHTLATRIENNVDATCAKEGSYDEVTYCTVCSHIVKTEHKINQKSTDHKYDKKIISDYFLKSEATCKSPAVYYYACSVCDGKPTALLSAATYTYGSVAPHVLKKVDATNATCSVAGNIEYWTCTVCYKNFSDANATTELEDKDINIAPIPHKLVEIPAKAPTCLEFGATAGEECSVCGTVTKLPEDIDPLGHEDKNNDHKCDNDGCDEIMTDCVDDNYDHYCDFTGCDEKLSDCEDYDDNHYCDYEGCGAKITECEDNDFDHYCDYEGCGAKLSDHIDENPRDHECDYEGCGAPLGECEDENTDHYCDYGCDAEFGDHEDNDLDHDCDYGCSESIGNHVDGDKDHNCDYGCAEKIGTCEDADLDHDCDYGCDKFFGTCEDNDHDHDCDYGCDKTFGKCDDADDDNDHVCDYGCGKVLEACSDAADDGDHLCDICGKENVTECTPAEAVTENHVDATCEEDGSYDTVVYCTECNEELSRVTEKIEKLNHNWSISYYWSEDEDGNVVCTAVRICSNDTAHEESAEATITGKVVKEPSCGIKGEHEYTATFGVDWAETLKKVVADIDPACPDKDKNHYCDDNEGNPDHYVGVHDDKNKDHVCDYGCTEAIGACEDKNKDHTCDYGCGKEYGTHEDKDKDHNCDYGCDKAIGEHKDAVGDKNHECDYCGETMSECTYGEEDIQNRVDSTCDKEGSYDSVYICSECNVEKRTTVVIEKKKHVWGATVYTWDVDKKEFTATRTCVNFASHVEKETVAAIAEVITPAKCESIGTTKYTSAFTVDWATELQTVVLNDIPALGHKDEAPKDHYCDNDCGKYFGECKDDDKDHNCDYGCDKYYGVHEDATGANDRPDHMCDYCGKRISDCVDSDKDHNCDFSCGETYGVCEDKNFDHNCDYGVNCPNKYGVHEDNDHDHKCDYGCRDKDHIPAHTWTEHSKYDTIKSAATCVSPAVYNNVCTYCKKIVNNGTHEYGEADTENGHNFNGRVTVAADGKHSVKCSVAGCNESTLVDCNYETTKTVAATCKATGYKVEKCTVCKNTKRTTLEIDPANHDGKTEVRDAYAATCNTDGYTGDTYCLGCNTKIADGSAVIANPSIHAHENMQSYDKVDSTCDAEGYEAYKYCDKCGTYGVAKVTIPKKNHSYEAYASNANGTHTAECKNCDAIVTENCSGGVANCVDKKVCEFCNAAYGEIDTENHKTRVTVPKKEATCQVEGNYAYIKCDACDTALEEVTTMPKKAHVYGEWTKVEGEDKHERLCLTCDADVDAVASKTEACSGGFAYCNKLAKCEVCKAEYGSFVFDAGHHKSTVTTTVGVKEATCCEKGYTGDAYYICCYDANKSAEENVSALAEAGIETEFADHDYSVVVETVPGNCKDKGKVVYACSTCPEGEEKTTETELDIDLSNHKSTATITVGGRAATCVDNGFTGNVYYTCCYDASKTESENRIALKSKGSVIAANGEHTYGRVYPEYMIEEINEVKDENGKVISMNITIRDEVPSYDEMVAARRADGYWYHGQMCSVCYEIKETRCYSYTTTNATCKTTEECEVCGGLCSLKNENNHIKVETIEGKAATCTEDGLKDSYKCKDCGKTFFDKACKNEITEANKSQLVIAANGSHSIDRKNQTPVVNNDGTHTYTCSVCGDYEIVENCTGGTATCKTLKTCKYCDASYGELNPKSHEKGTVEIGRVEPVGCKPGVKGKVVYECCGKVVSGGEEIPAFEAHTWVETTSKTDNCASGYTITRTCSVCDTVETEEVSAGVHELTVVVYETEKDCTKDRHIYRACAICSFADKEVVVNGTTYKYIIDEVIPAKLDCTWTAWKTEKATCVTEGSKTRECIVCGKTEVEVLPKAAHSVTIEKGYDATCEATGKQDYAYCTVAGCTYSYGGQLIGTVAGYEKYAGADGRVIDARSHLYQNNYCVNCGKYNGSAGENCGCVCHKQNGFMKIMYKIMSFFWKLFKTNRTCECGITHY